jgi:pimeloyl-ACP methyl ester carboxylesterase
MARLSLRNYLAVQADLAGGAEGCFQAVEQMVDRYSVHSRRIYLIGTGDGGTAAFRIACRQATAFAGVISVGGRFPLGEGLFGRLSDIRELPMLLCCTTGSLADSAPMQHDIDRTLRLFHAAGGLFGLRVYPELAGARWRPAASRAVLHDVDRWIMDEVCRIPANEATAIV